MLMLALPLYLWRIRLQKEPAYFGDPLTRLSPMYLLALIMTIFPFCFVDERAAVFPKPAIEALRGSARPGRGHASDAKRIGTRTKRGSRGLETI